jgi:hypothetical protein
MPLAAMAASTLNFANSLAISGPRPTALALILVHLASAGVPVSSANAATPNAIGSNLFMRKPPFNENDRRLDYALPRNSFRV